MKKIKKPTWGEWSYDEATSSFQNQQYAVAVLRGQTVFGSTIRATIRRLDKRPIRRADIQRIKDEVFGPNAEGFEVYGDSEKRPVGAVAATLWVLEHQTVPVTDSLTVEDLLPAAKNLLRATAAIQEGHSLSVAGTLEYVATIERQCAEAVTDLHELSRAKLIELDSIKSKLADLCETCSNFSAKTKEREPNERAEIENSADLREPQGVSAIRDNTD